jgi:hypothetical protein
MTAKAKVKGRLTKATKMEATIRALIAIYGDKVTKLKVRKRELDNIDTDEISGEELEICEEMEAVDTEIETLERVIKDLKAVIK